MQCQQCGSEMPSEANFCTKCGSNLSAPSEAHDSAAPDQTGEAEAWYLKPLDLESLDPLRAILALYGKYGGESASLESQVVALRELVIALLMEVEALRAANLAAAKSAGAALKDSDYARAYMETALLTHNSAGPSSGLEKLLARWLDTDVPK